MSREGGGTQHPKRIFKQLACSTSGVALSLICLRRHAASRTGHSEVKGLLNVEDEVYIAATLGCSIGVMCHPLRGLRPNGDADVFFPHLGNSSDA